MHEIYSGSESTVVTALRVGDVPVVFRYKGFRFFFYSNEGNPPEALHIHVRLGSSNAKFWVHPEVRLASTYGFDAPTLNELARVVEQNREVH